MSLHNKYVYMSCYETIYDNVSDIVIASTIYSIFTLSPEVSRFKSTNNNVGFSADIRKFSNCFCRVLMRSDEMFVFSRTT